MKSQNKQIPQKIYNPLTIDEKISYVTNILGTFSKIKDSLLEPESDWYNQLLTEQKLHQIFKKLCQHIGKKPLSITIAYSNSISSPGVFNEKEDELEILISSSYAESNYECIAILVHETIHYFMRLYAHEMLDKSYDHEEIIDLASIYSGLGLLYINGLDVNQSWVHSVFKKIPYYSNGTQLQIGYYPPKEYTWHLLQYVKLCDINLDHLLGTAMPWSQKLILSNYDNAKVNIRQKPLLIDVQRNIATSNQKIILLGLCAILILIIGFFVYVNAPRPIPADLGASAEATLR